MPLGSLLLLLTQAAQPHPTLDPYLPDHLRAVVTSAAQAELDPKRGPGNARQILKQAQAELAPSDPQRLGLELRIAGIILRTRFLASRTGSEAERYERALSTFSRLDLLEPGLSEWLTLARKHHPAADKTLKKQQTWQLKIALLVRGHNVDRQKLEAELRAVLGTLGIKLHFVPLAEATWVIKAGADAIRTSAEPVPQVHPTRAVEMVLGIERLENGKSLWQQTQRRLSRGQSHEDALAECQRWLVRIGGRDLFFRWLGESGFANLIAQAKDEHGHAGPGPISPLGISKEH